MPSSLLRGRQHKQSHKVMSRRVLVSEFSMQADRLAMEDRFLISPKGRFCAVFDGHGGDYVAEILRQTLLMKMKTTWMKKRSSGILAQFKDKCESIKSVLGATLAEINKFILEEKRSSGGSTAAMSLFICDSTDTTKSAIITANVGDSRVVLSQSGIAIDLTVDHKPELQREKDRINNLGGFVQYRVGNWRVQGILSMSRAIGDYHLQPYVSGDPEFVIHDITEQDEFVIVASDGLWEMVTSQEAVDFVRKELAKIESLLEHTKILESIASFVALKTNSKQQCNDFSVCDIKYLLRDDIARLLSLYSYGKDRNDNITVLIQWIDRKCE